MMGKIRNVLFFKDYFASFYTTLPKEAKSKVLWMLKLIEEVHELPSTYFKHIKGTKGIYEIRIRSKQNIYRLFCFFDADQVIVIGHGFQKKTQKTPRAEIKKAIEIMKEYYDSKR